MHLFLVLLFVVAASAVAYPTAGVTTFAHALKNMALPPSETEVYATPCIAPTPSYICAVNLIHIPSIYPGKGCPWDWENGRLKIYVDDETDASFDITLLQIANVGARAAIGNNRPADGSPFGHALFGKTASSGGVYTTMRVPFGKTIRVTLTPPTTCNQTMTAWFVIRGVMNIPGIIFGDFVLPPHARLRTMKNVTEGVPPLGYVTITAPAGAGTLALVLQEVQSKDLNFLEGCVRAYVDGASDPQFLSSGTEDYYLSASYYDEGKFTTPNSGVTHLTNNATAMYKSHERDPVMWTTSFTLAFRNFEDATCPTHWTASAEVPPPLKVGPADFSLLVWLYTW